MRSRWELGGWISWFQHESVGGSIIIYLHIICNHIHMFTYHKHSCGYLCLIFTILFQQGRLGKLPFFRLIRYGKTKDTIEPFWDESAERLERWWLQLGQKINGISQWKSAWWWLEPWNLDDFPGLGNDNFNWLIFFRGVYHQPVWKEVIWPNSKFTVWPWTWPIL